MSVPPPAAPTEQADQKDTEPVAVTEQGSSNVYTNLAVALSLGVVGAVFVVAAMYLLWRRLVVVAHGPSERQVHEGNVAHALIQYRVKSSVLPYQVQPDTQQPGAEFENTAPSSLAVVTDREKPQQKLLPGSDSSTGPHTARVEQGSNHRSRSTMDSRVLHDTATMFRMALRASCFSMARQTSSA
eukprot:2249065-Rhodomonas_salina.1